MKSINANENGALLPQSSEFFKVVDDKDKIVQVLNKREAQSIGRQTVKEGIKSIDLGNQLDPMHDAEMYLGDRKQLVQTVLVTGGCGYIGALLVERLLAENFTVVVVDSCLYENANVLPAHPKLTVLYEDIRDIEAYMHILSGVDCIFHTAEVVGDPACRENSRYACEVNYVGSKLLASFAKQYGVSRFFYFSSASVYGLSASGTISNENSDLNPISLYAKIKVSVEQYLSQIADSNFKVIIGRNSTFYGLGLRHRTDLFVNTISWSAHFKNNMVISNGGNYRPLVHIKDAVEIYLSLLKLNIQNAVTVFNIGFTENNFSILDVGQMVQEHFQCSLSTDGTDHDRRSYLCDCSKLHSVIEVKQKYYISTACLEFKKYFESVGEVVASNCNTSNLAALRHRRLSLRKFIIPEALSEFRS